MSDTSKNILKDLRASDKTIDISMLSDDTSPCTVDEWMSTGCLALDAILGEGLPVGRVTEIFGDESTGKSLIAAQVAAYAQTQGATVVYVDTETAVSKEMMEIVGVDIKDLIYASPDTVEDVFKVFDSAIESKKQQDPEGLLVLIWDSLAATSAQAEMEKDYGAATMGMHARLISQGFRKLTRKISKERVCMLVLNQTRKKIGVMFGDDTATFGGNAIKFHASVRLHLFAASKIKVGDKKPAKIVGVKVRALVEKNKVAMPFREAHLWIYFGHGVDDAWTSFFYLKGLGAFKVSGSQYEISIKGEQVKFQKKDWMSIYDKHFESFEDMIFESTASEAGTEMTYDDATD